MLGGVTPHADNDSLPPTINTSVGYIAEPETVPLAHTALDLHGHVPVSPFIGKVCEPLFLYVSAKYSWPYFILPNIWSFDNLITHGKTGSLNYFYFFKE